MTDIGVYGFDSDTKAMCLLSLHPGRTVDDVAANSGFDILVPVKHDNTLEPSEEELRVLRMDVDPLKYIIGR
jgi:glutaconate CoA-transferase, subunit B